MYNMTHAAQTGGMATPKNDMSNGKEKQTFSYSYVTNLYPFGYSDEEGKASLNGFIKKLSGGLVGSSKKKKHLDAIIDLDLNDPEQLKEAQKHREAFDNFKYSNIKQIQLAARLREDANRLYTGMPQKYNSFMINPDYESVTAKSVGAPTYTFTDPEIRKQYQRAGLAFNKKQSIGVHPTDDNQKSVFNRFSTVKSHDDGSGKYLEQWDLLGVPGNDVYIGDTIPANIGNGGYAFSETTDNTPTNFKDFVISLIKR